MKTATFVLLLMMAPALLAADRTGRAEAGVKYEEPATHAPANVSRMFARSVPRTGADATVELPAGGSGGMIVWTIPARRNAAGPEIQTRLLTPSGAVLEMGDRGSRERGLRRFEVDAAEMAELGFAGGAQQVMHVMQTAPAAYKLELAMPEDVAGVTVVAAEPESPITLSSWAAPLSRQPGQPVTLHAELRDGATPVSDAKVTARLGSPSGKAYPAIDLVHVGNGVYSATVADLPEIAAGVWQVRFEAEGVAERGRRFLRTGAGELVAERGAARLKDVRAEAIGEMLRVSAVADAAVAGTYRLDVLISDDARNGVAWGEAVRQLEQGATSVTIDIPLAHFGQRPVKDLLLDVRLLGLDERTMGVAGRVALAMD